MSNNALSKKQFDYSGINDRNARAVLRTEATAIKAAVKRTHDNIIEIGNRLIHAKEIAGHGHFMDWCEAEFGMSDRHARSFMQAAETFGKTEFNSVLNLPQTALFMLSAPSVSDETRAAAIDAVQAGEIKTTADTKAFIESNKTLDDETIEKIVLIGEAVYRARNNHEHAPEVAEKLNAVSGSASRGVWASETYCEAYQRQQWIHQDWCADGEAEARYGKMTESRMAFEMKQFTSVCLDAIKYVAPDKLLDDVLAIVQA